MDRASESAVGAEVEKRRKTATVGGPRLRERSFPGNQLLLRRYPRKVRHCGP